MPNEKLGSDHTEPQNQTPAEDITAPFQYGVDSHMLILYTNKNKSPFTIQAYIKSKGVIKITNVGTMGNELKMVIGFNKTLLPENEPIYITEDIKKLLNLDERQISKRKTEEPKKFDADSTGVHVIQTDTGGPAKKIVGF